MLDSVTTRSMGNLFQKLDRIMTTTAFLLVLDSHAQILPTATFGIKKDNEKMFLAIVINAKVTFSLV